VKGKKMAEMSLGTKGRNNPRDVKEQMADVTFFR
jgi:hypothetical protein